MNEYVCHSGGCSGSDMEWENEGLKYGVKTISYSFWNHKQEGRNPKILTDEELGEGFEHVLKANETMKLYPQRQPQYIKNLLSRNWFQVKNSESIFAVGKFKNLKIVAGGTGWTVQMAIDNQKPVFFFDQLNNSWTTFDYSTGNWYVLETDVPLLTKNFAGIGTREINDLGKNAIKEIYKRQFGVNGSPGVS